MFQGIFKSAINDANKNYIFGTGSLPINIKTAQLATFADGTTKQQGYQVAEVNKLISTMLTGWDANGNKPKSMSNNYLELILSCDNGFVVKKRLQFPHIIAWQNDDTPYNIADVYKPFSIDNWLKADDFENPDITLVVEPTDEILTTSTANPPEVTTTNSGRFYLYYRNLPVGINRVHIDFHIKTKTEAIDFDLEVNDGLSLKDAQIMLSSNDQAKINVLLSSVKDVYNFTGAEGNFEEITMHEWSELYQQIISLKPNNKFTHDLFFVLYESDINSQLTKLEYKADSVRSQILSFVDYGEKLSFADFPTVGGLSPNGDINPVYTAYRVSRIYCLENVESIYYTNLSALNTALAGIVLYDDDLNVIASLGGDTFRVTELDLSPYQNASYVRFCGHSTGLLVTILYDNNITRKLISYNDIEKVKGYFIGRNGSVYENENYIYFSIPCKYGMKLSFPQFYSDSAGCCFYAPNGSIIETHSLEGQQGSEITLTAPSDAYVLKVSCYFLDESSFYVRENIGSLVTSPTNGSIDKLKTNFITHNDDTDFIPEWIPNTFINQNGVQTNATGLYSTGKVYLQEGVNYYWESLINGYYAFYREDGSLIEGHPNNDGSLTNPFRVPIGTSYGRFTAPSEIRSKMAFISVQNFKPSPMTYKLSDSIMTDGGTFCNYRGNEICMFNKGLAIGDSLTEGVFNHNEGGEMQYLVDTKYSYPAILKKISGVDIVNKGVGGYTSDDWYNRFKNEDLSGFDFAIIQLGVNDLSRYGSWTSTTATAYTNIINKLKAENKNIKIFVATIVPAKNYFSANSIAFSDSIREFVASLNDANVILEDIAIYGHGKDSDAYNAGHLSALGYCRLAEDHKNLISYLISLDRNNYRYVQFIGTDYSYSD